MTIKPNHGNVKGIVFWTFFSMNTVEKSGIFLFLAVFVLGNTWVHVGTVDSGDVASDIKTSIN